MDWFGIKIFLMVVFWLLCGLYQTYDEKKYKVLEWQEVLLNLVFGPIKLICEIINNY